MAAIKIGKKFSDQKLADVQAALGQRLGLLNGLVPRPATIAEIEDFCFGPLTKIYRDFKEKQAVSTAMSQVVVPGLELEPLGDA